MRMFRKHLKGSLTFHATCGVKRVTPDATAEGLFVLGLAAESFHFPPAEMFADERKLPEGLAKHPHFLGARLNPLAHLNCYPRRGMTDFCTSAESVCLLRDRDKPPAHSPESRRLEVWSPPCAICPRGSSAVCRRRQGEGKEPRLVSQPSSWRTPGITLGLAKARERRS